jgi:hypothetical protein
LNLPGHRRRIPLNPSKYLNELKYWLRNVLMSICIAYPTNYNRVGCDEGTKEELYEGQKISPS